MHNFMELNMRKCFDTKTVTFRVWGLKTTFWQFGPKSLIKPQARTLASIFTKQASFCPEP